MQEPFANTLNHSEEISCISYPKYQKTDVFFDFKDYSSGYRIPRLPWWRSHPRCAGFQRWTASCPHHQVTFVFFGGDQKKKQVDVSKNRGTPKWMVYNGKPLLKWMIWGYPYFWKPLDSESCVPKKVGRKILESFILVSFFRVLSLLSNVWCCLQDKKTLQAPRTWPKLQWLADVPLKFLWILESSDPTSVQRFVSWNHLSHLF